MKRILYVMMLTVLLNGCLKNELENPDEGLRTIVANISSSETKTHIGEYSDGVYKTLWSEGDEIAVFPKGYNDKNVFTLSSGAGTAKGTFVGACDFKEGVAYYPADKCDPQFDSWNDRFEVEFPTRQKYVKDSFEDGIYPMIAKGENGKLTFTNILSIVRLNITGTRRVDSLVFSAGGGRWCSGRFTVSTLGAVLPTSETNPDFVTIDCGDGVYLQEDKPTAFHFVLPPWTYSSFNIKIYTPDGVMEKKSSNALVLKPSEIRSVPAFRFQLEGDPDYEEDIVEVLDGSIYPTCLGGKFDVSIRKNVPYIVKIYVDWIRQVETKETEIETLSFYVEPNASPDARTGSVYLLYGDEQEAFGIIQDGYSDPYVEISEEQFMFSGEEDGCEVEVTGNRNGISVCADADWIRASFTDSTETYHPYRMTKVLSIRTERNETHSARNANIIVSIGDVRDTLAVSQSFAPHGDLEIHIPEAGTLPDIIEGEDILMYTKVIITGEMNPSDIDYFMRYDDYVEVLDLSGTVFEDNEIKTLPKGVGMGGRVRGPFEKMPNLRELYLPSSLVTLGGNSFSECPLLEKVDWGDNPQLSKIHSGIHQDSFYDSAWQYGGPFSYCPALKKIDIPANVTEFESGAFYESGLEELTFSEDAVISHLSPTYISYSPGLGMVGPQMPTRRFGLFFGCNNLKKFEIPESVKIIDPYTFESGGMRSVFFLGDNIEIDATGLFAGCTNLESVSLPSAVSGKVPDMIFKGCTSLKEVIFNGKITAIGYESFADCVELQPIDLSSVTVIGDKAFKGCPNLKTINWDLLESIGEYAFSGTGVERVKLPDNLTVLPSGLFADCADLVEVDLNKVQDLNDAFYNCDALEQIVLPSTVTSVSSLRDCNSLRKVVLSGGKVCFRNGCFTDSPVEEFVIGKDVVSVSTEPMGLGLLDWRLVNVVFEEGSALEEVGLWANTNMSGWTTPIPDTVTKLAPFAFSHAINLKNIDGWLCNIQEIGECAFLSSDVTDVSFPEGLKTIGSCAFQNCNLITTVSLPFTLEYLGGNAFKDCFSLTSAVINGGDLQLSSGGIYEGCPNIKEIVISKNVKSISAIGSNGPFLSSNITSITFEEGSQCVSLSGPVFKGEKSSVKEVILPSSLTTLGENVFYYAPFENLTIPSSVTSMGKSLFYCCGSGILTLECSRLDDVDIVSDSPLYAHRFSEIALGASMEYIGVPVEADIVYCNAPNPPGFGPNGSIKASKIYVPEDYYESYVIAWPKYARLLVCENGTPNVAVEEYRIPAKDDNTIYYHTYDNRQITLGSTSGYGAQIMAHNYKDGLWQIVFDGKVTELPESAFRRTKLTHISLPESLESIEDYVFEDCEYLNRIDIPESIKNMSLCGFYDFDGKVYFTSTVPPDFSGNDRVDMYVPDESLYVYRAACISCARCFHPVNGIEPYVNNENVIYYMPTNYSLGDYSGMKTIVNIDKFNVNLLMDTYINGKYALLFDGPVTVIPNMAFYGEDISECYFPRTVRSVAHNSITPSKPDKRTLYLKSLTPPSMDLGTETKASKYIEAIYVPTSSVDAYKAASGWSLYADRIFGYDY